MSTEQLRNIRHVEISDAPTLSQLNQHVHVVHAAAEPNDFYELDPADALNFFQSLFQDPANVLLLSVDPAGEAVGYAWAHDLERPGNPFTKPARTLYIHHVAVAPAVRGQGIGRAQVVAVEEEARKRGISQIALDHWTFNEPAQRFFASLGFRPYNIRMRRQLSREAKDIR